MLAVKDLVGRVRPALTSEAATLGPVVPERAFGDRGRLLCRGGAHRRAQVAAAAVGIW